MHTDTFLLFAHFDLMSLQGLDILCFFLTFINHIVKIGQQIFRYTQRRLLGFNRPGQCLKGITGRVILRNRQFIQRFDLNRYRLRFTRVVHRTEIPTECLQNIAVAWFEYAGIGR